RPRCAGRDREGVGRLLCVAPQLFPTEQGGDPGGRRGAARSRRGEYLRGSRRSDLPERGQGPVKPQPLSSAVFFFNSSMSAEAPPCLTTDENSERRAASSLIDPLRKTSMTCQRPLPSRMR